MQNSYQQKKQQLSAQLKANGDTVRLVKQTSNLFRTRTEAKSGKLDVRNLNQVIEVNPESQTVEVEGMTTYETLTDACLQYQCMPRVVPQLKSITIGGAVSGIGIESSSFRHGLPHESVLSMEILLPDGEVVLCTPDNEHSDLFFGIPNSYGTLGYILKLTIRTMPVKPFVALQHHRYHNADEYFAAIETLCKSDTDFIDGTVFTPDEMYITTGRFVDEVPFTSDYRWMKIYYRSIQQREADFLSIRDYIWRWDTDWFWCSSNLYVQNWPMRLILGRRFLNSVSYQKVMRWNNRTGFTDKLNRFSNSKPESVVQDVDIPIERAAEFLLFFQQEINLRPVWICPIGGHDTERQFPFYPLHDTGFFINFGFWGIVPNPERHPEGHFNRLVEDKVEELGGIKSLYSDSFYDEARFWRLYNGDRFLELKQKYDPARRLKNLYQKCVQRR
ncbi:MAG: FAD-binding oxidoreductase [Pseudomonadota bacterium]